MDDKEKRQTRMLALEALMQSLDFWVDKERAQTTVREYQQLKTELEGGNPYDTGDAIMTIFSGAGGNDSEDFSRMLLEMYRRFAEGKGWSFSLVHENQNDHGGFRNVTVEIGGENSYGTLKNESGVHRLVRISPFNAQKKRHTSFSMVEVVPKFSAQGGPALGEDIPENEIEVTFARSSGPGGQNVNKRETAVRVVHLPTGLAVHAETERSQAQNREKALAILKGKLY